MDDAKVTQNPKRTINGFDRITRPVVIFASVMIILLTGALAYSGTRIEIQPGVQIAYSYDDNITLEHKNPQSDQIIFLAPQLLISWRAAKTDIELEYNPTWVNYQTFNERNYLQHNGDLTLWQGLAKHLDFNARNNLATTDDFLELPVVSNWHLPQSRGIYYTNSTTAELNYQFGEHDHIVTGYNYRLLVNEDTSLATANATSPPDDTIRHGPFARLNYQFDIRNQAALEYRYVRNIYKPSNNAVSNQTSDAELSSNENGTAVDPDDADGASPTETNETSANDDTIEDELSSEGEEVIPQTANDDESDNDFDDQTLTLQYTHHFNRHVKTHLNQRISIHRMVVSERSSEDYEVYDSTVGLDYQFSRHTGVALETGFSKQQGDPAHTSQGVLFNGSINHQFRHGSASLGARNGWNADSPLESTLEEDTSEFTRYWSIQADIQYQPWENVQTQGGLFYRNNTSGSSSARETWRANAGAQIGIAPWLGLELEYNHQFILDEQTEQTLDGDCTLNIAAAPWLIVGLNYHYRNQKSDTPENEYTDNRFTIDLSATPTRPYFWTF